MIEKTRIFFKSLIKEAFDERPNTNLPSASLVDVEKKEPTWELNPVNVNDNVGPPINDLMSDEEVPIGSSLTTKGDKMTNNDKNEAESMIRKEVRDLLNDIMPSKKTLKENVLKLKKKFNLSKEDALIIWEHPQIINDTPRFKKYLGER